VYVCAPMVCGVGDRAPRYNCDCFVFEAKARQRKSQPWGRLEAFSKRLPDRNPTCGDACMLQRVLINIRFPDKDPLSFCLH
jgi:hypothetical protein